MHGERHALVVQAVGEQVALLHRLEEDRAGEHDRRGFAGGAADLQDDAGEDAADRIGQHDRLMVCQRVAPTFQQASRKLRGTLARASRVLAMITGSVMIARVSEAERME